MRNFSPRFRGANAAIASILTHPLSLVIVAFVVTAIPAFLLTKIIGKHLENLYIMGMSLLVGGIVMWFIDAMNSPVRKSRARTRRKPHSHLAYGGYVAWPGHLDWRVPDSFGGFPWHFALDVDDRRRTSRGNVARFGS